MDAANFSQFKQFIVSNNIVGVSSGVVIAYAVNDFVKSLVGNLVVPGLNMALLSLKIKMLSDILPGKERVDLVEFLKSIISFVIIVGVAYFFIKFAFGYFIGVDTNKGTPVAKVSESFEQYQMI
jgi:large-conductance mechanosensitive channel